MSMARRRDREERNLPDHGGSQAPEESSCSSFFVERRNGIPHASRVAAGAGRRERIRLKARLEDVKWVIAAHM